MDTHNRGGRFDRCPTLCSSNMGDDGRVRERAVADDSTTDRYVTLMHLQLGELGCPASGHYGDKSHQLSGRHMDRSSSV